MLIPTPASATDHERATMVRTAPAITTVFVFMEHSPFSHFVSSSLTFNIGKT
jgi:hypothetical protein